MIVSFFKRRFEGKKLYQTDKIAENELLLESISHFTRLANECLYILMLSLFENAFFFNESPLAIVSFVTKRGVLSANYSGKTK